ncbi:uncharacterized protein [Brachyistius frenatus]|uniref:uncharacterized protein n=1 Tax=Brachyistius frenatus TaxID=100188 RepID=UPI0037E799C6
MCDRKEKDHKHRKTAGSKSQQRKHHCQTQGHPHHHHQHQSDDDSHDTHSTAEDNILSDHHLDHQNQTDNDKTPPSHSHNNHHKQNHRHGSLSETFLSSSTGSSSSSSSSSSSASSSSSPSSSSSSSSSPSSSSSSSSLSSSSATSSSNLSSENSSEHSDKYLLRKPQHSQSCTDISGKHRYFEERDDTAPLIHKRGKPHSASAKQKRQKGKSSNSGPSQGTLKNQQKVTRSSGKDGSFRKAKSMEALTMPKDTEGHGNEDEDGTRKSEARKNLMKEKMKFSAFLNEITRQVLSPMRLTTLGVTNAQRPSSPGQASQRSRKADRSTEKPRQQKSRPTSVDSMSSHASKYSTSSRLTHSKSLHHYGHHSVDSAHHVSHRPKSCTDISCSKKHNSWSESPEHHSRSASYKHHHHHHQGDHHTSYHHDHHHEDRNSPSRSHHHRDNHTTSHHHHHSHHSPANQHGDHHSPTYHNKDHHPTSHHHHYGDHHHGDHYSPTRRHGKHHSATHHYHHGDQQGHADPHHHGDNQSHANQHHHGDHHTTPHHHGDHLTSVNLITITMETTTANLIKITMEITTANLINITMKTTKVNLMSIIMEITTVQAISIILETTPMNLISVTMEITKVKLFNVAMETTTVQAISIPMETTTTLRHMSIIMVTTILNLNIITMATTTVQAITTETTTAKLMNMTMETTAVQVITITITMETTTVQTINITMETTTVNLITITIETNTVQTININMVTTTVNLITITMETTTVNLISITMVTTTVQTISIIMEISIIQVIIKDITLNHMSSSPTPKTTILTVMALMTVTLIQRDNLLPVHLHGGSQSLFRASLAHPGIPAAPPVTMRCRQVSLARYCRKILQEQNEGLHQSLLKTAVRMECLGEEFMSSQKLLETELQRTRMELVNLTERFKRLHDNCSSTQQTNNLLEQKLHSVAQCMEGERERLNQRISDLTERLADEKFANTMETFKVTSMLHKPILHFQSDDAVNQVGLPIAPPPAQFMDSFGKAKAAGQEQPLGSVPEEEESDWSEMGEEAPRFILTGSNRCPVWRHHKVDVDKYSESGGEDIVRSHSPRPLQIPHLTIRSEILPALPTNSCPSGFKNLSDGVTGEGGYRITTTSNLGSAILIRSTSLEEIPLACQHMQKELRGTEAMMNLHHHREDSIEDLDNEIIHHWRTGNDKDAVIGRPTDSRASEADSSLAILQSAEQMLKQLICEPQASEGREQRRSEVPNWTGGIPDEVFKGGRTQL